MRMQPTQTKEVIEWEQPNTRERHSIDDEREERERERGWERNGKKCEWKSEVFSMYVISCFNNAVIVSFRSMISSRLVIFLVLPLLLLRLASCICKNLFCSFRLIFIVGLFCDWLTDFYVCVFMHVMALFDFIWFLILFTFRFSLSFYPIRLFNIK